MKHCTAFLSITLIPYLISAQQWVRQLPFAGFAPLHAITFDHDGNGWAVGQQSLILHTANWGNIWSVQSGLPIGYTFEAVEIVPGTNAKTVLIGGPGLFRTTDGGETWAPVSLGQSLDAVHRIHAFDAQQWVVIGWSRGARTMNGGQSWTFFDLSDNGTSAAYFTDMDHGWAGFGPFNAYQLYKTINGGQTWEPANAGQYPVITDIHMINQQVGFMSARDYMYKTTNGGSTWTQLHPDVQPSFNGMHVVNENIIYSSLNNGFVFFTFNGGTDWMQVNPNVLGSNQVFDLYATADGRVWVPGKFASVLYTSNMGQSWTDQTPGTKQTLYEVGFAGETGFAVGAAGLVLRTTNNGAIWENITFDLSLTHFALATLHTGGQHHLWTGTAGGTVMYSPNLGNAWIPISQGVGEIHALHAVSQQTLIAGTTGAILRTTNSGQDWTQIVQTANDVSRFAFPESQTGYVTIKDGRIMKTTNGGASWSPVLERDNSYRFTGVYFHDALKGWAVAEFKDSIFVTTDGGGSWNTHQLPTNTFWQDIAFINLDTGYICGGSAGFGVVLRTTNGGQQWEYEYFETESLLSIYAQRGGSSIWAAGIGGNIIYYSPCATPAISNLSGTSLPCEESIETYEVQSSGTTIFTWSVPSGWTIVGNDNSARVDMRIGPGSGMITVRGANSCGVQTSTLTINVSSLPVEDVNITEDGGTLSTGTSGAAYQWQRDGIAIDGAHASSYSPQVSGIYTLVVTLANGCDVVSNAIQVTISGLRELHVPRVHCYPNPVADMVHFNTGTENGMYHIQVFDSYGRIVLELSTGNNSFNTTSLPAGVYIAHIRQDDQSWIGRFVR